MNEKRAFVGKPCDHTDADCEMYWYACGDDSGEGEWNLIMSCPTCGAHNDYYIGLGETVNGIEWYGEEPICDLCEEIEGECDCYSCANCGSEGEHVSESDCGDCMHDHEDEDCSCETCEEDEEE